MPRSWGLPRVAVALAIAFAASGGAAACKSSGVALSVDLRTDYLAGREFGSVVTEVTPEGGSAQQSALPVQAPGPDFLEGSRIADFADLAEGALSVKVRIVSPTGATLVERLARVSVHGDYALTVVVSRSCAGVECPVPDGDPKLSTCDRGQCVSPDCTPQNTGACGSAQCAYDADCHAKVDCIAGRCIAGTCLFVPDDAKCGGTVCDAKTGCGLFPTCSPTSTTEVSCADGVDDDCDGLVDCEDTDCSGKPCGDGCTEGGVCSGSVCTGGKPRSCDDGNPCTDDACVAKGGVLAHAEHGQLRRRRLLQRRRHLRGGHLLGARGEPLHQAVRRGREEVRRLRGRRRLRPGDLRHDELPLAERVRDLGHRLARGAHPEVRLRQLHGRRFDAIADVHALGVERPELRLQQLLLQRELRRQERSEPLQLVRREVRQRQLLRLDRRRQLLVHVQLERPVRDRGLRQRRDLLVPERADVLQLPVHDGRLLLRRRELLEAERDQLLSLLSAPSR